MKLKRLQCIWRVRVRERVMERVHVEDEGACGGGERV